MTHPSAHWSGGTVVGTSGGWRPPSMAAWRTPVSSSRLNRPGCTVLASLVAQPWTSAAISVPPGGAVAVTVPGLRS